MIRAPNTAVAFALLVALSLAACGGVPVDQPDDPSSATSDTPSPSDDETAAKTATTETASPSAVSTAAASVALPKIPREPIVPLGKFPGLSDGQVTGMLGTPQFRRQDAAAELWQYRGDGCVLHVFLYHEKDGLRVRHAEVRPRTTPSAALNATAADACLTKLSAAPPAATS